jgi:hypothetical protein
MKLGPKAQARQGGGSSSRGEDSRVEGSRHVAVQTQSWILLLRLNLPHQRQPSRRPPGSREPDPRPVIGRPINLQARQLQRHLRRSAFNRCGSGRLKRRGSPRRLKLPLHGQHANAAMRFAPCAVSHGQSSAWASVTLDRTAKPAIGPAGLDRCKLSGREKRWRSHFAPAIIVHPFAQPGSAARTPCLAREELRHDALLHGSTLSLEDRH